MNIRAPLLSSLVTERKFGAFLGYRLNLIKGLNMEY